MSGNLRYLLVTHIPFARNASGGIVLDGLWARDLEGIAQSGWKVRVCAPELASEQAIRTWGPSAATLPATGPIEFTGFPAIARRVDLWKWPKIRSVLRSEIDKADVVHTSNLFPPYAGLSFAHDHAVQRGRKTVFVIAEDFHDMLNWEWVRLGGTPGEIRRRRRQLSKLDTRARQSASTASLTFLHTPAAVARFRGSARNGIAIRQPGHETQDVIATGDFERKCRSILEGAPLTIACACRHKPLKGLDLLIRAIGLLKTRGIPVELRLFGNGEQQESLRKLTARLGLNEIVTFPGSLQPGHDVYRAIGDSHIFAMPHRTTDFGRAFFDAMAGGTPVLAFRTPASIETVRDGVDGLLAPLDDVEGLASAIQRLDQDRTLLERCAVAARARALCNTRSEWYRLRAEWTESLFEEKGEQNG
jgi:glycosyltransferase involved in cell wall biosynthesis